MKKNILVPGFYFIIFLFVFTSTLNSQTGKLENYVPDSHELYQTILQQDSIFFKAYNECDLQKQAEYYSENLEFYHDQGGLNTSKQEVLEATKKNICGKVTRSLVDGSIEVYPIKGFGAIEMGLHKFHNNHEKENPDYSGSKFIIIWQQEKDVWKITRVISLH